jgi:NifU-like protein
MAKTDLIGGSLWERYSSKVGERMLHPRFMGEITTEEAARRGGRLVVADHGAEVCGDAVRVTWLVDEKNDRILDSRFKTFGCGTAIASSDIMCEMCIGKTVDEAITITNLDVEMALRDDPGTAAIPPQKMHCSVMAYDVIKAAAAIYKGVGAHELEQEEIVCECARVSLRTIREVIRINDLKSVEEITRYTKAGAFCKSCIRPGGHEVRTYYLEDILRETRLEMAHEKPVASTAGQPAAKPGPASFKDMTVVQKLKAVEAVLNAEVRPNLSLDGGGLDVMDIQEGEGVTEVHIQYQGACRACPSGRTATLGYVESQLRLRLDDSIRVQLA